ncbi:hypothetical protein BDV96DRAFT_651685 [Lophiotrema nucula]|uniref:Uncharacterized protein n=1 Tax=Lophiotrema nucula TaxID=690887 RepID=A0A6A5YSK0_9PLEO|nr:hypothetical protein BDV96DRAFT_651685 [Lophiotrema nucula]
MSRSGVNLAVTEDGAPYNKLSRPTDYLDSLAGNAPPAPPKPTTVAAKPPTPESNKRKLEDVEDAGSDSDSDSNSKRLKADNAQKELWSRGKRDTTINRRMNPDTNMQIQFPGLDSAGNTSDEDTTEALAYLRSVRAEASTIPHTILAPAQDVEEEKADRAIYNEGDATVWYEDGTFVARELGATGHPNAGRSSGSTELHPQEQYYRQLVKRYCMLRDDLALATPEAFAERKKHHPDTPSDHVPYSMRDWHNTLDRVYPTPAVICRLHRSNILNGIDVCAMSLDRFGVVSKQRSCWIWTLLAKIEEVGVMDYTEVGRVRDLGHKAGQFSVRLRNGGVPLQDSEDEGADEEFEGWEADGYDNESEASVYSEEQIGSGEKEKGRSMEEKGRSMEEKGRSMEEKGRSMEEKGRSMEEKGRSMEEEEDESTTQDKSDAPALDKDKVKSNLKAKDDSNTNGEAVTKVARSQSGSEMSMSEDGEIGDDEPCGNIDVARARLMAQLDDRLVPPSSSESSSNRKKEQAELPEPEITATADLAWNTMVTIDMIITVVGECYGQKDLLRFRNSWDE